MRGADVHIHQSAVSDLDAPLGHRAVSAGLEAHLASLGGNALEVARADEQLNALAAEDDQAVGDALREERPHRARALLSRSLAHALLVEVYQLATDPPVRVSEVLEEVLDPLQIDALRAITQLLEGLLKAREALELLEALVHANDASIEQVEQRDASEGGGGHDELGPRPEGCGVDEGVLHGQGG